MSSSSSSKPGSEVSTTSSSSPNHSRMKYTLERKWLLLKNFQEQDQNYIYFAAQNKIPRQTFKRWIDEADTIEEKVQHFPARRFRSRESTRPELDRILIAWYNDMRTNNKTYPITRALLLDKAVHFQKLLDHLADGIPIQQADVGTTERTEEPEDNSKLFEPSDILDEDLQKYIPPPEASDLQTTNSIAPTQSDNQTQSLPHYESSKTCSSVELHQKASPGRGIINHYNKCYAIAIIQQLHKIAEFREIIISAELEHLSQTGPVKVCIKLKQLFQALDDIHNKHPAMMEDFFNIFIQETEGMFMPGVQADASEFLFVLLDILTDDIMPATVSHPIHDLFYYTSIQQYICPAGHVLEEQQVSRIFPLPLGEGETLEATLFKLKYGDVMRTYKCSKCHNQNYRDRAISRTIYLRNPQILIFQLQRFGIKNPITLTKKQTFLSFPIDTPLYMKPFSKSALASEEAGFTGVPLYQMICTGLKMWGVHNNFIQLLPPSLPSSSSSTNTQLSQSTPLPSSQTQTLMTLPAPDSPAVVDLDEYDEFGDQITQSQRTTTSYSLRLRSGRQPEEYARLDSGLSANSLVVHTHLTPSQPPPPDNDEREGLYKLIGVVAHIGPYGSGHYISYIRNDPSKKNTWLLYNDTHVSATWHGTLPKELFGLKRQSSTSVYAEERKFAYILFYRQIEPASSPLTQDGVSDADSESDQIEESMPLTTSSSSSSSSSVSLAISSLQDTPAKPLLAGASGGHSEPPAEVCFLSIDKTVSFSFSRRRKTLSRLLRVFHMLSQWSMIGLRMKGGQRMIRVGMKEGQRMIRVRMKEGQRMIRVRMKEGQRMMGFSLQYYSPIHLV